MKTLFITFNLLFALLSCNKNVAPAKDDNFKDINKIIRDEQYVISYFEDNEGRPTFNVLFPDGNVWRAAYAEEIALFLKTGKIEYNECLEIVNKECSE